MTNSRRNFIKQVSVGSAALATASLSACASREESEEREIITNPLIVPKAQGLKITGTFLDEISHDIVHQNWGEQEWDRDFAHMKAIGINTVIVIRSGYR